MRSASSYRGAKKKAAREAGVKFAKFNEHYQRSRMFAQHEMTRLAINATPAAAQKALDVLGEDPAEARRKLGIWARNGGRATAISPQAQQEEIDALNAQQPPAPMTEEQVREAIKKLTPEDVDKALELTLTNWQKSGRVDPLPLSKLFADRAREKMWVEGVEFVEENG